MPVCARSAQGRQTSQKGTAYVAQAAMSAAIYVVLTVIIPFVLRFAYSVPLPIPLMMLTVCIRKQ